MENQSTQETILNISIACSLEQDFIALLADDEPTAKLFKVDQNSLVEYFDEVGLSDKYLASIKPGLIDGEKHLSVLEYTEIANPMEVFACKMFRISICDFIKEISPDIDINYIFESLINENYVFKIRTFDTQNTYAKANFLKWIGWKENDLNSYKLHLLELGELADIIRNSILSYTKELTYEAVRECVSINEGEITIDMRKAIKE